MSVILIFTLCVGSVPIHMTLTRNVFELFNTFVRGLKCVCNIAFKLLGVDRRQWVIEPALMPT